MPQSKPVVAWDWTSRPDPPQLRRRLARHVHGLVQFMSLQTKTGLALLILVSVCVAHGAEPPQRLDLAAADELFQRAILDLGGIDKAVEQLQVTALDTAETDRERSNAWLTIAHLHWRYGQLAAAADATENALAIHEDVDAMLLYARLLDARGDPNGASPWYERAAQKTNSAAEKDFIRLRLTLSEASNRNVDALIELAKGRDRAFRNRASITLALLGHPDLATGLYEVSDESGNPFRQRTRIAHWAIEAGEFERAQMESWQAYEAAATRANRLYALALLVEAHRKDDALAELLVRLAPEASGDELDADLLEARIDVLIETENYDEAIAFYQTIDHKRVDPLSRRRLISLYETAGRTDEMIAEYEALMAAEPDVVPWFAGLASHYLNVAQPEAALSVWQKLVARNPEHVDVLTEAAEAMVQMGFVDEAVAMIEDHMVGAGESFDALLFLFELRHARGEEQAALSALERLQAALAGGTHGIRDLADAYERLNRPEESIRILEALRASEGELGYNERMRLAWLLSFAGRKEDAMGAWQNLWVSVESPARRHLAESQFLLLATELNKLGDIVVDLEEKLILKRADRNEIGLLVRIYTEVGDSLSATEVIEEFARYSGAGEIDRLRRLARVHMMLSDYAAYDKVLRELVTADPDNRLEHTQNIVLNMLAYDIAEESQGRFGEIQRWLGQLRELDNEGVSGEFEAGIYSLGGFAEEAIASYRRALVADPENSDNLLLLADMLKNAGRRDEAVEMLQYAAEHAADNSAFVVAIDGIINMIGARSFNETLTARMRDTFGWTRRIILERIAGHDGKFYLYQLLADIAQEVGDMQAAFVALENSLSEAGLRRPAVLRELVTLATPNAGFAGFTTGAGDAERQITHGRRLVGLKRELPPEVYINLGKVLLKEDAVQDAERAFDRIDDITGMIDVERTKANLFYDAGFPDRALAAYTRALNVRRDDLSLLTRTALLREALGQDAVAHTLYFRGLSNLLRAQPSTRPTQRPGASQRPALVALGLDADTSVTRDYRQYFEALMQGLLITWPDEEAVGHETVEAVKALFDTELEANATSLAANPASPASDPEQGDLAQYPRLERMSWFANRVADRAADPSLRAHVDGKLQRYFPIEATEPEPDTPLLRRQLNAALRDDDFETAVRLARVQDDEDGLVSLLRERIDAGKYRDGLGYARSLLDPMALRRLLAAVAPTLKDNKRAFAEAISTAPAAVLGIEEDLGRDLISSAELVDLLNDPAVADDTDNPFVVNVGIWKFIKAKWDVDQQIGYFAAYAARQEKNEYLTSLAQAMLHDLLSQELTPAQGEALLAAGTELLGKLELKNEFALSDVLGLFLDSHVIPANRVLIYELAELVQASAQISLDLHSTLRRILDGTGDESFTALIEWEQAGLRSYGDVSGHSGRYADIRAGILGGPTKTASEANGSDRLPPEFVRTVYEWEFPPSLELPSPDQAARQTTVLPGLIERFPDDDRYRLELAAAYLALNQLANAEVVLFACYRRNVGDEFLRAALFFHLLNQQQFASALELATDGGPDLRDEQVLDEFLATLRGQNRFQASPESRLFRRVYRRAIAPPPFGSWPIEVDRSIDFLRQSAAAKADQSDEAGRRALRVAWRGADDPEQEQHTPIPGLQVAYLLSVPFHADPSGQHPFNHDLSATRLHRLDQLIDPDADAQRRRPRTLLEAVANAPYSADEFERYVGALPADQRRDQHRLYRLLADAHEAAGTLDARVRELTPDLDRRSDHDFAVWMMLRDRRDVPINARELADFRSRARAFNEPGEIQVLAMARLFAKAGEFGEASQHYRWLAAMLVEHKEFSTRLGTIPTSYNPPTMDLAELIEEVAERLPQDVALDTAKSIIAVARRAGNHETYDAYFDAFLLKVLPYLFEPEDVAAKSRPFSRNAADSRGPTQRWHAVKAAELVRSRAMAGRVDSAIELLRDFVASTIDEPDPDSGESGLDSFELGRATMTFARLYGYPRLDGFILRPERIRFVNLILYRERLFPSTPDHRWPGDLDWMAQAAEAFVSWLDDPAIDATSTLEAALVIAWQLHGAGEADRARDVLARIAARVDTEESKPGLHYLARMAVLLGVTLPTELAREALDQGVLTLDGEVETLRRLAVNHDAATTLAVGRLADIGGKLALMQFLAPLAERVGDQAYSDDLERRIGIAENARLDLGIGTSPR